MIPLHYVRWHTRRSQVASSQAILYAGIMNSQARVCLAHAGNRTRVTSMGGLYDTTTLRALVPTTLIQNLKIRSLASFS